MGYAMSSWWMSPKMALAIASPQLSILSTAQAPLPSLKKLAHTSDQVLQLSVGGQHRLLLVLSLLLHQLLITSPVHRPQSLRKDRVRVVEARVEPVGVHAGQVLDLQLEQRRAELLAISEVDSERVYAELA